MAVVCDYHDSWCRRKSRDNKYPMKTNKPKDKSEYKVTYHYVKPKNEAEAKEQAFKINEAYDLLFNTMLDDGIIKFVGDKVVFPNQKTKCKKQPAVALSYGGGELRYPFAERHPFRDREAIPKQS